MSTQAGVYGNLYLDTEVASIDVVAQEEVSRGFWAAPFLEELHEVILHITSMNGTAWRSETEHTY